MHRIPLDTWQTTLRTSTGVILVLVLALSLAACDGLGDSEAPASSAGNETSAGSDTVPGSGPALGAWPEGELGGRIVAVSVPEPSVENVVSTLDLATGEVTELWRTGPGINVSDFTVSPDGTRAAYRVIQREAAPPEAIIVRDLVPGAEPLIAAATDTDVGRLAGYAWSPDGSAMAYGRQLGHLRVNENGAAPAELWELHVVNAGGPGNDAGYSTSDRSVWNIDGEALGPVALEVVAWYPDGNLAAVTETAADGGATTAVRLIDTARGEEVARVPTGVLQFDAVGSPDGRYVALPETESGAERMQILDLVTGETADIALTDAGPVPGAPIWSPGGKWLAWTAHECANPQALSVQCQIAAASVARVMTGDGGAPEFARPIEGEITQALSFDPTGTLLLVGEAAPGESEWTRVSVHPVEGGEPVTLPWAPPSGTWRLAWVE